MMNGWMMMTGLVGMMSWMMPGCGGIALAQCGMPCGGSQHAAVSQDKEKSAAQDAGARHTSGKENSQNAALPSCPVMGETADFNIKTMTDDGPVYFCCDMCIPKFEKNPAKYAEKLAAQRTALTKLDRVQVTCPVDGKNVDGKLTAEVGGHKIAFCTKECQAKYTDHPGAFKAQLADSYTYQTRCPISAETVQPNVFTDLGTGQRIYFCCASCGDKLLKDPAKYAPKLEEQRVRIDPKKVTAADPKAKKDDHSGHKHP
ncbi:MAG: hypothetical protein IT450_09520 [Phycisphaerales bacterium]|nr:hypothetical protein [Phycisphaerales bacterium]